MKIGVPKEIKDNEFRVAVVPAGVRELTAADHRVLVEAGAGIGAGFDDAAYVAAGAAIVPSAEETFAGADLIVKVKEPQAVERRRLRADQVLGCPGFGGHRDRCQTEPGGAIWDREGRSRGSSSLRPFGW